jgi:hypothetical protein
VIEILGDGPGDRGGVAHNEPSQLDVPDGADIAADTGVEVGDAEIDALGGQRRHAP